MTLIRVTRLVPRMHRSVFKVMRDPGRLKNLSSNMAPACSRDFFRGPPGRRDPFTQMEEFMRDMERKFKRDIDSSLSSFFRDFPRVGDRVPDPTISKPGFGDMENISTEDKYKLAFNFANANPEDVKVTLKGRMLTVSGHAETSTETSKSSHEMSFEYQLPEEVNVDALESSLSHDGILTIEAPQTPPADLKAPQTIDIKRE